MKDPLKQFTQLRTSLLSRQSELQNELAAINAALGTSVEPPSPRAPKAAAPVSAPAKRGPRKRAKNSLSLLEAVLTATKDKPLPKQEILTAVEKLGYVFSAKSPLNSLNTLLYGNKSIKNQDGKFGPK